MLSSFKRLKVSELYTCIENEARKQLKNFINNVCLLAGIELTCLRCQCASAVLIPLNLEGN